MTDKVREQVIELGVHSFILFMQSWACYVIYIYVRYGGIFRDKSNKASYVEPSDPLFTLALLFLMPFCLLTLYRVLCSLGRLVKTIGLKIFVEK